MRGRNSCNVVSWMNFERLDEYIYREVIANRIVKKFRKEERREKYRICRAHGVWSRNVHELAVSDLFAQSAWLCSTNVPHCMSWSRMDKRDRWNAIMTYQRRLGRGQSTVSVYDGFDMICKARVSISIESYRCLYSTSLCTRSVMFF